MFQIIAYIKFLITSTKRRHIGSPFVYDLITKCFHNREKLSAYTKLNAYRNELLNNNDTINVTDFGAGSRVFKSNKRAINAIAKNAGITPKRAKLLLRLTKYFRLKNVLELGTSLGLGTSAISFGNTNTKITTLEGCPETAKIAQHQFEKHQLKNIQSVVCNFSDYLETIPSKHTFDLIYFDGNHQKEPTIRYFNKLVNFATNDSIYIFDDIHWSEEMEEAWEYIKTHPKVTISIDTFFWGIIFFRKEQKTQEHFKIKL